MRKALRMVAIGLMVAMAGSCDKPAPQAKAPSMASHRAIYELSLAHASSKSNVTDASGRLVIEWQDVCEGFTTNQRFLSQFSDTDGGVMRSDLTVSSWESADGARFRFNVVSSVNGKIEEQSQGEGRRDPKAETASAAFQSPAGKSLDLPKGTVFPTEHMNLLLAAARKGERMFARPMFDGSFESGTSDVSAYIGAKVDGAKVEAGKAETDGKSNADIKGDAAAKALLDGPYWPIRMAFFSKGAEKGDETESVPDYEFALKLHDNGVASDLLFDYGDFSVSATLKEIEVLPGCEAHTDKTN